MLILCSSATLYDINYTKNTIPIAIHFSASRRKPTGYLSKYSSLIHVCSQQIIG